VKGVENLAVANTAGPLLLMGSLMRQISGENKNIIWVGSLTSFLPKNFWFANSALHPFFFLQLDIHFTTIFELRAAAEEALVFRAKQGELGKSRLAHIARYVAATGQVGPSTLTADINISDKHFENGLLKVNRCFGEIFASIIKI
jgi:hypothetical protein